MTAISVGLAVLVLLIAGAIWRRARRRARRRFLAREGMPSELAMGRVVLSEGRIAARTGLPVDARVDQVFDVGGRWVPVETKTQLRRPRVTPGARMQLSAQAYALARSGQVAPTRVATHGWVRVPAVGAGERSRYLRVELAGAEEVEATVRRREAVLAGREAPRLAREPWSSCPNCRHATECGRNQRKGRRNERPLGPMTA